MNVIENRTYAELKVGDCASVSRAIAQEDIWAYAAISGDFNPIHTDVEFARDHLFRKIVAHGNWAGMLISAVVGMQLPGPGSVFVSQTLNFRRPIAVGDEITASVMVREKAKRGRNVLLDCRVTNQSGEVVLDGTAVVAAPRKKVVQQAKAPPIQIGAAPTPLAGDLVTMDG